MTEAQAKEAISQRWVAAWGALQPTVPFALGNEAFPSQGAATFAALSFGPIVERQLTQGAPPNRRFEYRGSVIVRLFGAVDDGGGDRGARARAVPLLGPRRDPDLVAEPDRSTRCAVWITLFAPSPAIP